jgi:HEPN domain-containing protein/predicted nucleotidyltransferase
MILSGAGENAAPLKQPTLRVACSSPPGDASRPDCRFLCNRVKPSLFRSLRSLWPRRSVSGWAREMSDLFFTMSTFPISDLRIPWIVVDNAESQAYKNVMVTNKEVQLAVSSIRRNLDAHSVILFGSVAREGTGNDVDLLVLIDGAETTVSDADILVRKSLRRCYKSFSVDPYVMTLSQFREYYRKGSPFLHLIAKEGRVTYMRDAVEEWVKQAKEDLDMSEYLLQGRFFKGACYHAQQSLEKVIKAKLFSKGWDLEKTHSIARLSAIAHEFRVRFPLSDDDISFLDNIYRGRYPMEAGLLPLGSPSQNDAQRAVDLARLLHESVAGPKTKRREKKTQGDRT